VILSRFKDSAAAANADPLGTCLLLVAVDGSAVLVTDFAEADALNLPTEVADEKWRLEMKRHLSAGKPIPTDALDAERAQAVGR
jgi:hypothetical protein